MEFRAPTHRRGTLALFAVVCLPFGAGYFLSYLYRSINAVIGPPIAREFGLGAGDLGLLTSAYFLGFGLLFRRLSDHRSPGLFRAMGTWIFHSVP